MPSPDELVECLGGFRAKGVLVGLDKDLKSVLKAIGFFGQVLPKALAGGVGSRLLSGVRIDAASRRVHHLVKLLQRGEALPRVIVVQATQVVRLAITFVGRAGIDCVVRGLGRLS